jgi:phosphoglycolate phosphatase
MRLTTLLFDFDGTLAELNIDFSAMRRGVIDLAAAFLDRDVDDDGTPVLEAVERFTAEVQAASDRAQALEFATRCRFLIMDIEIRAAAEGRLFPGVRQMLADMRVRGMSLGVVTRNCTPAVDRVFPEAPALVDCLLAREAVRRTKPDPAHLFAALECLGAEPGGSLMIGDHPMDVEAGRRAGLRTAAVASGRMGMDELAAAEPDFLAPDVLELVRELAAKGLIPGA